MSTFCLLKEYVEKLKKALRDGEVTPEKLQSFNSSSERRAFLAKYVGEENAKQVNALFESKLNNKNIEDSLTVAFKKVLGMSPAVKRDVFSRISRINELLDPENPSQYYEDLVSTRLGLDIPQEAAKTIKDVSAKMQELKKSYDPKKMEWTSQKDADLYGATQRVLEKYLDELKYGDVNIKTALSGRAQQFKSELSDNPARATAGLILDTAKTIANTSVTAVATLDDSVFGRQGITTLLTGHPKIWGKAFLKSFSDIVRTLGNKNVVDGELAKLYSDPLYMNGEYQQAKIVDMVEEQYPISLESLPVIGKPIKAAEVAFKLGSLRMRTQLYKTLRDAKVSHGIEMTKEEIEGTGKVVNSIVAKGALGKYGDNPIVRLMLWAPKMLKADLDILTAHSFDKIPKSDRVTARFNLIKIVLASALITEIYNLFHKDRPVELDARSSDFMKAGGFGYLRGMPQLITLVTRFMSGEYKNASGEIIKYEPGIAKRSRLDAIISFLRGKAPPATGAVYDILAGEDYQGNPPTFTSILIQRGVPISIQNLIKLSADPSLDNTFGVIGDFFGLNSNINPEPNIKSDVIPEKTVINKGDLISYIQVYAKALRTDPETAFNRAFTGQKIMQVSEGGIIVVDRQAISDSESFKKQWVKEHGGKTSDIKEIKLDHIIPNKLGGEETENNWAVVPTSVWSANTKVETTLISAVKKKKISLKDAQELMRKYKRPEKNSSGYWTENPDKELGQQILDKYK